VFCIYALIFAGSTPCQQKDLIIIIIIIIIIVIIIIQHLYSALKSCKGYGGAGGFRLRLSEQVCFEVNNRMGFFMD